MPDDTLPAFSITIAGEWKEVHELVAALIQYMPALASFADARAAHAGSVQSGVAVVQLRRRGVYADNGVLDADALEWAIYLNAVELVDAHRDIRNKWIRPKRTPKPRQHKLLLD